MNPLVGKTITAVYIAKDRKALRFDIGDAQQLALTDGDCCSVTWIESVEAPEVLIGLTVLTAAPIPMPRSITLDCPDDDCKDYGFQITTERGHCVIAYRNASNGYYGGSLEWPTGDPHDYYYGGVHGQNVSAQEWERIA